MLLRLHARAWLLGLLLYCLALPALALDAVAPPPIAARAWLLMDAGSGQLLASQGADERMEPASLTKLMTAYLVFEALRDGRLALDRTLSVSEKAVRTGGARMFIDPKKPVSVEDLIKGMVVQSANDATVALAEAVGGSEDAFVQQMNREAGQMGLKNTHFTNATGLPDPKHYSSARDLALLAVQLMRDFPGRYKAWYALKEFRYNNFAQANRNRLLWIDPAVDGVKTGHTDAAGYCLIASAVRGPRRLLSVVLGAASDNLRTQESQKLLNHGFQSFDGVRIFAKGATISTLKVWKGSDRQLAASVASDLVMSVPKGAAERVKAEFTGREPVIAPVAAGQEVGRLKLSLDGRALGEYPVVALKDVPVAGLFWRTVDTLRMWLN